MRQFVKNAAFPIIGLIIFGGQMFSGTAHSDGYTAHHGAAMSTTPILIMALAMVGLTLTRRK